MFDPDDSSGNRPVSRPGDSRHGESQRVKGGAADAAPVGLRRMLEPFRRMRVGRPRSYDCEKDPGPGEAIHTIIESDIVPRLLMAHSAQLPATDPPAIALSDVDGEPGGAITGSTVEQFAQLPLSLEAANLAQEIDRLLESGVAVEAIYVDLLAPTARILGEMWERDECDFVEVTMGLWRLQEVMREIGSRYPSIRQKSGPPGRMTALFCPLPGDDHSFGALMIDEVFARAGWSSEAIPLPQRRELLDTVSRRAFDCVGLTVTRDCPVAVMRNLIQALRKVSANPDVVILVGGRFIDSDPAIVAEIGADGTGADARGALDVAERLVASAPSRARIPE